MKKRTLKNKKASTLKLCILAFCIVFFLIACDNRMITTYYTIKTDKVNEPVRLAAISDLHGCYYGINQSQIIDKVVSNDPDVILFSGDIEDDIMPNQGVIELLEGISDLYPCYYVTGNHEVSRGIDDAKNLFDSYGVKVLDGDYILSELNDQQIQICGVDDPVVSEYTFNNQLKDASAQVDSSVYSILIAHRPERIENYMNYDFDLIVSGHAHGGQWRIPYILNGLYAPHQGLFPEYAGGLYEHEETVHIVSRGLDKHNPVPRVFNQPELVIIDIIPSSDLSEKN